MSSLIRVMWGTLLLLLIKDSIQQTDPPIVEVHERKFKPPVMLTEKKMKQSDIRDVLQRLDKKLSQKLYPDFRETIICLLEKFITEEIMSIEGEKYMDEFNVKYDYVLDVLIEFLKNQYEEENPNAVV